MSAGAQTASTCDVGIRSERRQTVCAETFRMDNPVRRRGGLRVPNTAFLGWGQVEGCYIEIHWRGYGRCSFCRSVDVAVGHDKRPPHCKPARKAGGGLAQTCTQRAWPYLYCVGTRSLGQSGIPVVD